MRLFALRGASSVQRNEADQILGATDELMRELIARNALTPEPMVSCIFTLTTDLDAEFPAVAARRLGLDRVPLLCAQEVAVPGSMPKVIRVLVHYYAPDDHEPQHVYLGEARALRADLELGTIGRTMAIEFAERIRRIPVYPVASGYDLGADVAMLASNESFFPPAPAVVDAARRGDQRRQPVSRSRLFAAAPGAVGALRHRRRADRARERLVRHPAGGRRGAARAGQLSWSMPGLRSASIPTSAAASGARAIEVPLDADDRHQLDAMAAEITVATRLVLVCNPNNPTSTSVGLDAIEDFLDRVPQPRVRDPR